MICASNYDTRELASAPLFLFGSANVQTAPKSASVRVRANNDLLISVEAFVWRELSLVPEVERVCVEREENGNEYRVISIVNERDAAVRKKIYAREQAIMDSYPILAFDFHVASRMGRDAKEIVYGMGNKTFER